MYNFKHYLNFLNLPQIGTIQISEPFGFDGSSFKVEQDSKRFGRDVFKANEEIELEFTREQFERLNTPQILPDGTQINHASQGWDYLIQLFELYGWESRVEKLLEKDSVIFTEGIFDYFTAVISNDSIKFKIIQDSAREKLKRNSDTFVDAFNDKDLDGNPITPCATTNILLKAKPIVQNSVWEQSQSINKVAGENTGTFLPSRSLTSFEIENSYIPFNENSSGSSGGGVAIAIKNFTIIEAKSLLVGITAKMKTDILFHYQQSGGSSSSFASLQLQYVVWQGDNPTIPYGVVTVYEKKITGTATQDFLIDQDIDFNLPSLNIGQKLAIYWRFIYDTEHISRTEWDFNDTELSITAISQGIDSVIKGVRLIDLIKHNIKSASGLNTIAPLYDVGGIYYDTFAFNGYLIGQITDKEFNNKFKDLMEILPETFQDYQINTSQVEILPSYDYYANNEIGAFVELPDHESTTTFNKRYFLNTADIGFKNSSKNRETNGQNTIDDVHGTTQWKYPNTKADGNLKLELDHIRSAFLIEEARRLATNTDKTTSLQNDSKLFLLDVVSLSPSAKGGFGAVLLMNELDNGHLQILNNNTDGTLGNFNWGLLGFGVGAQFFIDSGENVGTWQVWSITDSILELFPMTVSASFTGEAFIEVSYFLTDVAYVNRTNEGFSVVQGVENPTNYSNLLYSVKRIMQRWYPYFATATKYVQGKFITNTSFEPNGNLVTRFIGESANVVDNADISTTDISSLKVLNPIIHDITVYCDYSNAINIVDKVVTDKGFIRVMLNSGKIVKGYPQVLDYEWTTSKLNLKLEEKFESDFMTITESAGVIYINEVGYSQKTGLANFEVNSDFVVFYDGSDIALNNPIHYTKVSVNGTTYTDVVDFSDAIQNLIE